MTPLVRIVLEHPLDLEDPGYDLFEYATESCAVQGTEILSDTSLALFVTGSEDAVTAFIKTIPSSYHPTKREVVPLQNWVQQARSQWQPFTIGKVTIHPLLDDHEPPGTPESLQFFLTPGLGFGTGEHDTTAQMIELLQSPDLRPPPAPQILDLGTGSGILALVAHRIFGGSVTAIDNDPLAIDNARENHRLNGSAPGIELVVGDIQSAPPRADLIIANIYAEVLMSLEPEFRQRLAPGGSLLLSGIAQNLKPELEKRFSDWECRERLNSAGWASFRYMLKTS